MTVLLCADAAAVARLALGLRRFADRLTEATGVRTAELMGGGAAGGIAAGTAALFGATVEGGFGYLAAGPTSSRGRAAPMRPRPGARS